MRPQRRGCFNTLMGCTALSIANTRNTTAVHTWAAPNAALYMETLCLYCHHLWKGVNAQMRVVLNAATLMGGTVFSIANVWGMNLWHGPTRLKEWPFWTFYLVRWLLVGSASRVAPLA